MFPSNKTIYHDYHDYHDFHDYHDYEILPKCVNNRMVWIFRTFSREFSREGRTFSREFSREECTFSREFSKKGEFEGKNKPGFLRVQHKYN